MYRIALALALLTSASPADSPSRVETLIMATTDLHCRLLPERGRAGSLADVAAVVRRLREESPEAVLLDAGDAFEGSPTADYYATVDTVAPHPLVALMNRMGYSGMALGNHEFTYGLNLPKRLAAHLSFPMLAANVTAPSNAWQTHTIVEAGPVRILVIGVTTPGTALSEGPWLNGVRFDDPVPELRRIIPRLRKLERPDIVCVLAHTGLGEESTGSGAENSGMTIARAVPGIDVLFLGHTHTSVDARIGSTLVLQAGARGACVATARLAMERKGKGWKIVNREGELVPADGPPDSAAVALCRAAEEPVGRWLDAEVGTFHAGVSAKDGALRLDGISRLIAEAMMHAGSGDIALVPLPPESLTLPAGPVRRRDLYSLQPYLNRLVTVRLSSSQVRACLEQSAATWAPYAFDGAQQPSPAPGKRFDSFLVAGGLTYVLDYTAPVGERVVSLRRDAAPPSDSLDVVVSSYQHTGAGGFDVLRTAPVVARTDAFLRDVLIEHVADGDRPEDTAETWWSSPSYRGSWAQPVLDMLLARSG
ncbi:MAG: bifunctional metallophosphatase/5'-nucleotidase, partial [Candidatus Eisenbacteria bacterium]|nr:bifunctional metallophosphatase/5'-nucleotidase [Candidatus Eisenbacteria bacterium]